MRSLLIITYGGRRRRVVFNVHQRLGGRLRGRSKAQRPEALRSRGFVVSGWPHNTTITTRECENTGPHRQDGAGVHSRVPCSVQGCACLLAGDLGAALTVATVMP